jgi:hypothetical protein
VLHRFKTVADAKAYLTTELFKHEARHRERARPAPRRRAGDPHLRRGLRFGVATPGGLPPPWRVPICSPPTRRRRRHARHLCGPPG